MHTRTTIFAFAIALAAAPAAAQTKSLIFTGRFPFKSLDLPNERVGGSITALEEFDFSFVTPGPSAFARSLQPATAHQAYYGDGNADGNFTKFFGFKTYFQNVQMGGVFCKHTDKSAPRHDKVFFTVRSNAAPLQFEAFTANGTALHVLRPGDFVRFTGNGNLEFFCTQDQLDIAAGLPTPTGTSVKGASAMCQDAAGNLYYSPATGGHWVNGNTPGTPVFANDGAIVMIDVANITYDANGNVTAFAPNSARVLIEETNGGPSANPVTTRQMVLNAAGFDRTGAPLAIVGIFGKLSGLDLDPNGGTTQARFPDPLGAFSTVPNFVFCGDPGSYGGTIFSTNNNGSLAVINGVLCGSNTAGVPANGSWLGVQLDVPNSQPSLMGLCVVDEVAYEPLVLDMPTFGAVQNATLQPTLYIDAHGVPTNILLVFADFPTGGFPPSVPSIFLPLPQTIASHVNLFPLVSLTEVGLAITDAFGYASFAIPNPHTGTLTGLPVILQGATLDPFSSLYTISTPVLMQFK